MKAPPLWPSHFPKAPLPNTITLEVRISTYKFGEDTNNQTIAIFITIFPTPSLLSPVIQELFLFFKVLDSLLFCRATPHPILSHPSRLTWHFLRVTQLIFGPSRHPLLIILFPSTSCSAHIFAFVILYLVVDYLFIDSLICWDSGSVRAGITDIVFTIKSCYKKPSTVPDTGEVSQRALWVTVRRLDLMLRALGRYWKVLSGGVLWFCLFVF